MSNLDENILPVPLFIKSPHQETGKRDDGNAETIDILPTIAELLEQEIPWAVDGVSLISAEKPAGKPADYQACDQHEDNKDFWAHVPETRRNT